MELHIPYIGNLRGKHLFLIFLAPSSGTQLFHLSRHGIDCIFHLVYVSHKKVNATLFSGYDMTVRRVLFKFKGLV